MKTASFLLLLVGCSGSVAPVATVEAVTVDAAAPCVTVSRVGVATILEYATLNGPVTLACFDDPSEDEAGPCSGCGVDNGHATNIVTWGADQFCKNSARGAAACALPSCILGPDELCP